MVFFINRVKGEESLLFRDFNTLYVYRIILIKGLSLLFRDFNTLFSFALVHLMDQYLYQRKIKRFRELVFNLQKSHECS